MSDATALNLSAAIVLALLAFALRQLARASKKVEAALAQVRRAEADAVAEQDERALRASDEDYLEAGCDRLRQAIRDEQRRED